MNLLLVEETAIQKAPPRLCHILDFETERSLCGAKPLAGNEGDIHDKETCSREHQSCVVCVSMFREHFGKDWM